MHKKAGSVHVVFGSECTTSMDYKAIAVFHSFKTSGWKGNITRLLACSPEQKKTYKGWDIGPTFVHPNYHYEPGYEDSPTYNKPAALMHFTAENEIEEEFILYIDADMLLRRVINPADYGARKGLVITEYVWYVREGILNGLADQFIKDADARERAKGTHGGYYHLIHVEDAKKVAPRWLYYTREVRLHPEKYWKDLPGSTLTHDIDTMQKGAESGEVPWISEMFGYAFAAAEIGLEHAFTRGGGGVLYGDDFLTLGHPGPIASHYTLSCQIPSIEHYVPEDMYSEEERETAYTFSKHEFRDFDPMDCDDGFLFPNPPRLPLVDEGSALCAEDAERINYALCDFYRRKCPMDSSAYTNSLEFCPYNVNDDYRLHFTQVRPAPCGNNDGDDVCEENVKNDKCRISPPDMALQCLKACGFCTTLFTEEDPCFDKLGEEECKKYADEKECLLNPTFMTFNCRQTCGACPKDLKNSNVSKGQINGGNVDISGFANDVEVEMAQMDAMQMVLPFAFFLSIVWTFKFFSSAYIKRVARKGGKKSK